MPFILNRRLFTDATQAKILEDGDPAAAYLIGGEGTTLTDDIVKKYGLGEGHRLKENYEPFVREATEEEEVEEAELQAKEKEGNQSSPPDLSEMSKAELADYAKSLGIEVKSNWGVAKITDEIEALQAKR